MARDREEGRGAEEVLGIREDNAIRFLFGEDVAAECGGGRRS
jgi:hypothetical protein